MIYIKTYPKHTITKYEYGNNIIKLKKYILHGYTAAARLYCTLSSRKEIKKHAVRERTQFAVRERIQFKLVKIV